MKINTNTEQQYIDSHRDWILDRASEGPYTGNLITQLSWMQLFLDSYKRTPTDAVAKTYIKSKGDFDLMLTGAGL